MLRGLFEQAFFKGALFFELWSWETVVRIGVAGRGLVVVPGVGGRDVFELVVREGAGCCDGLWGIRAEVWCQRREQYVHTVG